ACFSCPAGRRPAVAATEGQRRRKGKKLKCGQVYRRARTVWSSAISKRLVHVVSVSQVGDPHSASLLVRSTGGRIPWEAAASRLASGEPRCGARRGSGCARSRRGSQGETNSRRPDYEQRSCQPVPGFRLLLSRRFPERVPGGSEQRRA